MKWMDSRSKTTTACVAQNNLQCQWQYSVSIQRFKCMAMTYLLRPVMPRLLPSMRKEDYWKRCNTTVQVLCMFVVWMSREQIWITTIPPHLAEVVGGLFCTHWAKASDGHQPQQCQKPLVLQSNKITQYEDPVGVKLWESQLTYLYEPRTQHQFLFLTFKKSTKSWVYSLNYKGQKGIHSPCETLAVFPRILVTEGGKWLL